MSNAEVVEVALELAAPPADVYRYWTDAERYPRWMGRLARLDPTPGGEYFVQMNDGFAAMGTFLELDAPPLGDRASRQARVGADVLDNALRAHPDRYINGPPRVHRPAGAAYIIKPLAACSAPD